MLNTIRLFIFHVLNAFRFWVVRASMVMCSLCFLCAAILYFFGRHAPHHWKAFLNLIECGGLFFIIRVVYDWILHLLNPPLNGNCEVSGNLVHNYIDNRVTISESAVGHISTGAFSSINTDQSSDANSSRPKQMLTAGIIVPPIITAIAAIVVALIGVYGKSINLSILGKEKPVPIVRQLKNREYSRHSPQKSFSPSHIISDSGRSYPHNKANSANESASDSFEKKVPSLRNSQYSNTINETNGALQKNDKESDTDVDNMIFVKGGTFLMGSDDEQDEEKPRHLDKVKDFYLDKTEVTQEEYQRVTERNPSFFKDCPKCPVENVTWYEARKYCERIGKRLPSEKEWEYACRAGSPSKYHWGNAFDGRYMWYQGNSEHKTHNVGSKSPNSLGLYDMTGNIWEWCYDWWRPYADDEGINTNQDLQPERCRVIRGGAFDKSEYVLRSSARGRYMPEGKCNNIGFRCAR
jgi:formylglycine-generating enzyme required for sulfatase activity